MKKSSHRTSDFRHMIESPSTKIILYSDEIMNTAISRKVVGKNVHAKIPKDNKGYDQYTLRDFVAVEPTFVAFL